MSTLHEAPGFHILTTHVVDSITYKPGYRLICRADQKDPWRGRLYFQVECERPDVFTGEMGVGRGGKAYLSEHMTESELVRVAFGLFKAYEEHETREWFKYRDVAVFNPHIEINALMKAATNLDFRD